MRDRRSQRIGVAGGIAVALTSTLLLAFYVFGVKPGTGAPSDPLSVSIETGHPGPRVPQRFLGLSFELSRLGQIARYADRGDFVAMLRSLGPGVLRFGGISADTRVAWTDAVTPRPAWASSTLDAGALADLRRLAAKSRWRILLTIGLAHYDPRAAAREAAAAQAALGHWLAGIEVGNEPDAYARHGLRSAPWTFSRYDTQLAAYRRAIEKAAPGLDLVGPDVSGSHVFASWGRAEAIHERPALLTGHHYPLGCHSTPGPTIAGLLSRPIRRAEDASLHRYMSVAHDGSIHFRLDETNTVSCGGKAGISDTFASALWATDYIAHAMLAGVWGINVQGNPANCRSYTPVCAPSVRQLAEGALIAQPEWYALLLSKALVGDRPVRATATPSPANVDVIALLGDRGELHVVIVDDDPPGAKRAAVELHVGSRFGSATALSLTAPSLAATLGVRLGGRAVGRDGAWSGPARLERIPNRSGAITLDTSPASAVLVTIAGRPQG
jgi:hypothetical protein